MTKPSATFITIKNRNGRALKSAPSGKLIKSSGKAIIPQVSAANADIVLDTASHGSSIIGLHSLAFIGLACGVALSLLGPMTHNSQHKDLGKAILASLKGNLLQVERSSSVDGFAAHRISPRQQRIFHVTTRIAEHKDRAIDPLLEKLPEVKTYEHLRLASFSVPTSNRSQGPEKDVSSIRIPKPRKVSPLGDVVPHGSRAVVGRVHSIIKKYSPKHSNPGVLAHTIVQESAKQGVDPLFVAAVIKAESTFNNTARSNKGAQGLMQIMPATGAWLRQKHDLPSGKLSDPGHNLKVGITYLKELVETYKGDRMFALVAYNWGPGHVDSATGGKRRIPKECMTYALKILGDYKRWRSGVI